MKDHIKPANSFAAIAHNAIGTIETASAFVPYFGKICLSFVKMLTELKKFNWSIFTGLLTGYGPNSLAIVIVTSLMIGALSSGVIGSYLAIIKNQILVVNIIYGAVTRGVIPLLIAILMLLRAGVTTTTATYLTLYDFQTMTEKEIWPRALALCLATSLLYIYAAFVSLLTSAILVNNVLDISFSLFFDRLGDIMEIKDFLIGLGMEIFFAFEIILVASFYGWYYRMKHFPLGRAVRSMLIMVLIVLIISNTYIEFVLRAAGI